MAKAARGVPGFSASDAEISAYLEMSARRVIEQAERAIRTDKRGTTAGINALMHKRIDIEVSALDATLIALSVILTTAAEEKPRLSGRHIALSLHILGRRLEAVTCYRAAQEESRQTERLVAAEFAFHSREASRYANLVRALDKKLETLKIFGPAAQDFRATEKGWPITDEDLVKRLQRKYGTKLKLGRSTLLVELGLMGLDSKTWRAKKKAVNAAMTISQKKKRRAIKPLRP